MRHRRYSRRTGFDSRLEHLTPSVPTTEQPHRTIVTTDFAPDEVIVRGGQGTWFKVLHWLVSSGIWAQLPANQKAVLVPLHQHRQPDGFMLEPLSLIGREAGTGRSATYEAIQGLLAHPAGLLARRGSAFVVMPEHAFAGRAGPPASAAADDPVRQGGRLSGLPDCDAPAVRALRTNQPDKTETKTQDQSLGQTKGAGALKGEVAGWSGLGLFWDPEACSTVEDLLRKLDVGEQLRFHIGRLAGITVAEVASVARAVAADPSVEKPVPILAWRLFNRRGLKVPSTSGLQLTGALARIQQIRNARLP